MKLGRAVDHRRSLASIFHESHYHSGICGEDGVGRAGGWDVRLDCYGNTKLRIQRPRK